MPLLLLLLRLSGILSLSLSLGLLSRSLSLAFLPLDEDMRFSGSFAPDFVHCSLALYIFPLSLLLAVWLRVLSPSLSLYHFFPLDVVHWVLPISSPLTSGSGSLGVHLALSIFVCLRLSKVTDGLIFSEG